MSRSKRGIPSQETVPAQDRYPVQSAADMDILTTAIPTHQINSNTDFPMPKPAPAGNEALAYMDKTSEFITDSHTNGKTKK